VQYLQKVSPHCGTAPNFTSSTGTPSPNSLEFQKLKLELPNEDPLVIMQEVASSGKKCHEDTIDEEDPKEESAHKKEVIKPQKDESLSEEDLHRDLVAAIFEYGVTHACPSTISDNMQFHPPELTKDRIKSRLQKFRKRRKKEKDEFLDDYDKCLDEAKREDYGPKKRKLIPKVVVLMAHSVTQKSRSAAPVNTLGKTSAPGNSFTRTTNKYAYPAIKMPFPVLTEKEKSSAIGKSLDLTLELVQHMHTRLVEQRQAESKDVKQPPPNKMMACHPKRRASTQTSQKEAYIAAQEGLGEYSQALPKQEQPQGSHCKRTLYNMQPSSNEAFQANTLLPPRMGSPFPPGVLDGMGGCAETLIASTMTNMLGIMGGDRRATRAVLVQYGGPVMITPPSTAKCVAEQNPDSASIEGFGQFFPIDGNMDACT
jgi:SHAQKYF class myb-like DNA-binding protein